MRGVPGRYQQVIFTTPFVVWRDGSFAFFVDWKPSTHATTELQGREPYRLHGFVIVSRTCYC